MVNEGKKILIQNVRENTVNINREDKILYNFFKEQYWINSSLSIVIDEGVQNLIVQDPTKKFIIKKRENCKLDYWVEAGLFSSKKIRKKLNR